MDGIIGAIIPSIVTIILANIVTYVGMIHNLKLELAVSKKTIEDLQKALQVVEKRLDSHSKKNDDIVKLITDLKVEVVTRLGELSTNMGKLSSDVDNINRTFTVFDNGITGSRYNKTKG